MAGLIESVSNKVVVRHLEPCAELDTVLFQDLCKEPILNQLRQFKNKDSVCTCVGNVPPRFPNKFLGSE
ncbi:hypothetical protein A8B79_10790 [Balneola sp. EhC07]|nr:hypothetical protein A8B79_10790 [Balneola sp. EhC07]